MLFSLQQHWVTFSEDGNAKPLLIFVLFIIIVIIIIIVICYLHLIGETDPILLVS